MQLHDLKPNDKTKNRKRVGRGGKRGTFSGCGSKGQKARAGHGIRQGFSGGDNPIWKLFPKQRGASKKTDIKHALFRIHQIKPITVSLTVLNDAFQDGETVSPRSLVRKGVIKTAKHGVKILASGEIKRQLTVTDSKLSAGAREKIIAAGGK